MSRVKSEFCIYPVTLLRNNLVTCRLLNTFVIAGDFPTVSTSRSVFAAFDALKNLTDSADEDTLPAALLAAMTSRAIENLGAFFKSLLSSESASARMLSTVSTLLSFLLTAILPLFISRLQGKRKVSHDAFLMAALDDILGQFTGQIFIPLIRSFGPLSESYIMNILSKQHAGSRDDVLVSVDIRSDLCCLFRQAVSDLDYLSGCAVESLIDNFRSVKACVALESVREMDKACLVRDIENYKRMANKTTAHTTKTRTSRTCADRISKLAKKDTQWFLCTILHTLFTPSSAPSVASPKSRADPTLVSNLLEDSILTGLSSFLERNRNHPYHDFILPCLSTGTDDDIRPLTRNDWCGDTENGMLSDKCYKGDGVDTVGHEMILAVVERAWSCWFKPGMDDGA